MSGECEICHEHALDCLCAYDEEFFEDCTHGISINTIEEDYDE